MQVWGCEQREFAKRFLIGGPFGCAVVCVLDMSTLVPHPRIGCNRGVDGTKFPRATIRHMCDKVNKVAFSGVGAAHSHGGIEQPITEE